MADWEDGMSLSWLQIAV